MRPNIWHVCVLVGAMMVAAYLCGVAASFLPAQEGLVDQLKGKLSETGVFFRADAPRSLRNPGDA